MVIRAPRVKDPEKSRRSKKRPRAKVPLTPAKTFAGEGRGAGRGRGGEALGGSTMVGDGRREPKDPSTTLGGARTPGSLRVGTPLVQNPGQV